MNLDSKLNENLSKLLFLEIGSKKIYNMFNIMLNESIYLPIKSGNIIKRVQSGEEIETIPLAYFIEGMFYVLGGDENFIYNTHYIDILQSDELYIKFIKGTIFDQIKKENYEEAYILLKGLISIEKNIENYDKLLLLVDDLRISNKEFEKEEIKIISEAKKIKNYPTPYLYESLIFKDKEMYDKSLYSLNKYIELDGKNTSEIDKLKNELEEIYSFNEGKKLAIKNPEKSLKLLLPLKNKLSKNHQYYYYIALAYRNLGNHEKAIFYLNEAIYINGNIIEYFNEIGLNYACIGEFQKAIQYFRKVFEVNKSIEVCTNLIMCYIHLGDIEQAQSHLKIGEVLDPDDEILIELKEIVKGGI